jgi:inner membrane protein YidH
MDNDPRVFFAAERTLLAWLRTAIALIGLGFVVARFGLFLQLLDRQMGTATSHHVSPWMGMVLALLGSASAAISARQHQRFCASLRAEERPARHSQAVGLVVGYGVAIVGVLLAVIVIT